jgi:autotransporter-associated beta strand protein
VGSATITNNKLLVFSDNSTGSTARLINGAVGTIDLSFLNAGMTAGSIEGAGTISLGSKNLQVGGNNLSTTFSGMLQDGGMNNGVGGSFTKAGTGTLTLAGVNTYTGATTVNAGTLVVDGSIVSSTLTTVNAGGTLAGVGIVGDTRINSGGVFAPGNGSLGTTMTVAGNLAFQSGAIYLVQGASPAATTFANVTGGAMLAGTVLAAGSYAQRGYDVLHAAGGLNGTTFNAVNVVNPNYSASLSYSATDVFLNLTATLGAGTALNQNQRNVAGSLSGFFNRGGVLPAGFFDVFGLTGGNLGNALTQLSGEGATASQQTTFDAMNQFLGVLTDPFIAGRGNPISAAGNPNAYTEDSLAYGTRRKPNDALAAIYTKAPPIAPAFEQRWSVWAAGYGGSQRTNGDPVTLGTNDTRSSIYGTAVGADYRFSPNTIAGFALAGGGTNFGVNNLGSGRSDLFQAGAFIRHNAGPAYITGALAYGWQDVTTNRTVNVAGIDQLRAEFNANAWSGRVEGGYRFVSYGIGITPYAAGQFTTFDLPAYTEQAIVGSNQFALAYNSKSVTDTRSELGLRGDKSMPMPNGIFTLRGRLAWAHDYNPDRSIGATFQTLPGVSFVVNGATHAADSALTTASAEWKWLNGWSTAATFEGEFSNVTQSYAGKGTVRYAW